MRLAEAAYSYFKENGRFPTDIAAKKGAMMNANFGKMNALLDELGPEGTRDFLMRDFTVKELKDAGHSITGENAGTKVNGSAIFGPKIGQGFFQNLNGNYDPTTMDLWFMRAWGRLTGTLTGKPDISKQRSRFENALQAEGEKVPSRLPALIQRAEDVFGQHERDFANYRDEFNSGVRQKSELTLAAERLLKGASGINEQPTSGAQRQWMRDRVGRARELLAQDGTNVTNADLQAIWWYPEKELYGKLGGRDSEAINADYAGMMRNLARARGVSDEAIERSLRALDQRPGSAGGANVGRGNQGFRETGEAPYGAEEGRGQEGVGRATGGRVLTRRERVATILRRYGVRAA